MWRGDRPQRLAFGQMDELVERIDQRREQRVPACLELGEICLFGKFPGFPEAFDNFTQCGPAAQKRLVDFPQLHIGGVEKFEPAIGAVDRNCRPQIMQDLLMILDMAGKLGLDLLDLGAVDGKSANRPVAADRRFGQLHQAACPGRDDMMSLGMRIAGFRRPRSQGTSAVAGRAGREFGSVVGAGFRLGFDSVQIGRVDVVEGKFAAPAPHRKRKGAQRFTETVADPNGGRGFGGSYCIVTQPQNRKMTLGALVDHPAAKCIAPHPGSRIRERFHRRSCRRQSGQSQLPDYLRWPARQSFPHPRNR